MWNRHIHTGTQNVHNVHNAHIDNIGIPKHKKHLWLLSSGTKLFIHLFEFKGFLTWGEKHSLSMLTFPSAHPPHHHHHVRNLPQGLGELRKSTVFLGGKNSTPSFGPRNSINWLFFKSPKSSAHASGAWRHSHPAVTFSIWGFYCDISEWHVRSARAWTPALKFAPN